MKKFFYWRFSRKIEGEFLKKWAFFYWDRNRVLSNPRYRPYEWSEKSEVKVKSIFGPLNLFIFGYVKGGVLGNNNIGIKKCTTTFLWVLNLGQVGGRRKNFQNHTTTVTFWKMVSKVIFGNWIHFRSFKSFHTRIC